MAKIKQKTRKSIASLTIRFVWACAESQEQEQPIPTDIYCILQLQTRFPFPIFPRGIRAKLIK